MAQDGPPPPPPPCPLAASIDKNGDGELSSREIKTPSACSSSSIEDRDDTLSAEELRSRATRRRRKNPIAAQNPPPTPPPPSELMTALDADGDGTLSETEISKPPPQKILELDKDSDGRNSITPRLETLRNADDDSEEGVAMSGPPGGPPGVRRPRPSSGRSKIDAQKNFSCGTGRRGRFRKGSPFFSFLQRIPDRRRHEIFRDPYTRAFPAPYSAAARQSPAPPADTISAAASIISSSMIVVAIDP